MMSSATPAKRSRRNVIILALLLVLVVTIYTFVWIYIADKIEARANHDLAELSAQNISVRCENLNTQGFPLRINVVCDGISWQRPAAGISFLAGKLSSGFPVYAPRSLTNALTGPALIEFPGIEPLEVNWSSFTSNTQLVKPFPTSISLAAHDLTIGLRTETTATTPIASLGQLDFSVQGSDGPLTVAGRFSALQFPSDSNRNAPNDRTKNLEIDGIADIELGDAAAILDNQGEIITQRLRGQSGTIRQALLAMPNGASVSVSGPFSVDDDGLISAALKITLVNPQALAQAGQTLFPEYSGNIATIMFGLSAMPRDANGNPQIAIDINRGKARAGFIPLGRVPAL